MKRNIIQKRGNKLLVVKHTKCALGHLRTQLQKALKIRIPNTPKDIKREWFDHLKVLAKIHKEKPLIKIRKTGIVGCNRAGSKFLKDFFAK